MCMLFTWADTWKHSHRRRNKENGTMWETQSNQYWSMQLRCSVKLMFSPWDPSSLHFIGHCDICGPNIILPTFLAQHSSQDRTTVHSNTHVHICLGFLSDIPVVSSESSSVKNKAQVAFSGVIIKLSQSLITTKEEKHSSNTGNGVSGVPLNAIHPCTAMFWSLTNMMDHNQFVFNDLSLLHHSYNPQKVNKSPSVWSIPHCGQND